MFKKLKSFYFRLYEIELELSMFNNETDIINIDEYDYLESIKLRKVELQEQIEKLINKEFESKN